MRPTNKKYHAFGLIEVLITVVILSVALLGIASIQNRTIQAVQEGDNLVNASIIAQEMAQRMMSNPYVTSLGRAGYLATDINDDIANAGGVVDWANGIEASNPDILRCYSLDNTESCVASGDNINVPADHINGLTNMQLMDEVELRRLAWTILPEGEIKICFDETNPTATWACDNVATRINSRNENIYTVKIRWNNILSNTLQQYTLQFTAECTDPTATGCGN